jgi:hypothetical protein
MVGGSSEKKLLGMMLEDANTKENDFGQKSHAQAQHRRTDAQTHSLQTYGAVPESVAGSPQLLLKKAIVLGGDDCLRASLLLKLERAVCARPDVFGYFLWGW